nr:hypothetical protein [Tanacetum cinerariifolium]
ALGVAKVGKLDFGQVVIHAIRGLAAGVGLAVGAVPVDVGVAVAFVHLAAPAVENLDVGAGYGAAGLGPELLVGLVAVGRENVGQEEEYAIVLAGHVAKVAAPAGRAHGLHRIAASVIGQVSVQVRELRARHRIEQHERPIGRGAVKEAEVGNVGTAPGGRVAHRPAQAVLVAQVLQRE